MFISDDAFQVLMGRGHAVVLSSGAAVGLFFQSQLNNEEKLRFTFRTAVFDSGWHCLPCTLNRANHYPITCVVAGALQPHAFTVDMQASLKEYYQLADGGHREGRIQVQTAHPAM